MQKTRGSLTGRIRAIFGGKASVGEEDLEHIEEVLIQADVGVAYTTKMIEEMRKALVSRKSWDERDFRSFLFNWVVRAVGDQGEKNGCGFFEPRDPDVRPEVILFVGVNGTGKTTTIGKLSRLFIAKGRGVMLVAGDTYRAAAPEQLEVWAKRSGSMYHRGAEKGDAASVVHDALTMACSASLDTVLVDTAGRLHTKEPLMRELEKIMKVASRVVEGAPHQVVLVLDATTGQNALVQARSFMDVVGVTGIIITKMDGSAKGGILIPISCELGLPIHFVGMGEGIDDLVPFDPEAYAEALI